MLRQAIDVLPNLLIRRAQSSPDRVVVEDVDGEALTYREFVERASTWADALGVLGVEPWDNVLVMEPTSLVAYELWMGIALAHCVEVPVNVSLSGRPLGHVMRDSGARAIVTDARYLPAILEQAADCPQLETIVVTGAGELPEDDARVRLVDAAELLGGCGRAPVAPDLEPWSIATIMYTSGTTGPAKGVLVPWGQMHAATFGSGPERTLRAPHTVYYSPYPSNHVSGKTPLYAVVLGGGRLVIRERFSTSAFWDDIRRFGCTYTLLVGSTAQFISRQPPRPDDRSNPLEAVLFSPWIPEVNAFAERFGVETYSVYNMTEISCPIVDGWDGQPIAEPRSCGRLRDGFQARIVDEHDRELPDGEPGELIVRTDVPWMLMSGYWRQPGKTVEAWRNQWLHTGDVFVRDADGRFYYRDRIKDSIRRNGENIASSDIEAEVLAFAGVAQAAAVAVPDEITGEEIKVVVVAADGGELDIEQLHAFLSGRLPRFMVPRYLELAEALPMTETSKVRKAQLRAAGVSDATWDSKATAPAPR